MKPLLRVGFVALIALGLASQALRASRGDDDADPKGALIARLERLPAQIAEMAGSDLLLARSPACELPFVAGLMQNDGADNEMTRQLSGPDIVVRYVYLGSVEERPSRVEQTARWGWATALFSTGLRRTRPSAKMVVVAYPGSCAGLDAIDWAALSP